MRCSVCGDPTTRERCRSCAQFRRQKHRDRRPEEVAERRRVLEQSQVDAAYRLMVQREEWQAIMGTSKS